MDATERRFLAAKLAGAKQCVDTALCWLKQVESATNPRELGRAEQALNRGSEAIATLMQDQIRLARADEMGV